ncbi:aminoglycoside 6-adenylyltransferase [Streptococcus agalactiae]
MRDEQEIYNLVLNIANQDKRIEAVLLNGSRLTQMYRKMIFKIMILFLLLFL